MNKYNDMQGSIAAPPKQESMATLCAEIMDRTVQANKRLNHVLDSLIGPRPASGEKNGLTSPCAVGVLCDLNTISNSNLEIINQIEKAFGV